MPFPARRLGGESAKDAERRARDSELDAIRQSISGGGGGGGPTFTAAMEAKLDNIEAEATRNVEYVLSAEKAGSLTLSNDALTTLHTFSVKAQKNTDFNVTGAVLDSPNGTWTCPANGLYSINYELNLYHSNLRIVEVVMQICVGTTVVRESITNVNGASGDDFARIGTVCSTIQDLTQLNTVSFKVKVVTSGTGGTISVNAGNRTTIQIVRVG